ncbi:hypothetical protein MATL_G00177760 [Megalops atlanticus]|uniref:Sperm associated antigen 17 n=1 Tax=Megalops atlanticus TaxID=7932 RepID=A0A9D3T6X4_MEGAT|nr:hypothetical protein MATL_G00177760 [Megalops atlanticus]
MPPKRVKSGNVSGAPAATQNKTWESGLVAAPFEEDTWKADISLLVGERWEDEDSIKALLLAAQVPARRLFSVITWDATLEKINELGNPKSKKPKDVPIFYEVMESAKSVLDAGEEIPSHLLGKLIKFQLLVIKANDQQRRAAEQRPADDKAKGKTRAPSALKDKGGAAKHAGKGDKGKKQSEPAPPAKETKLKRRGEGDETSKYIDDEPGDGPQHYVLIVGFHLPQLIAVLDTLGIHVSNVIKVSSEIYGKPEVPLENTVQESTSTPREEAGERQSRMQDQLDQFWKYLEPVLKSGPPRSKLFDVARLKYTVKEGMLPQDRESSEAMLAFGMRVFEGVACLIYDCLDWRRQHLHYLSSMRLIQVPTVTRGDVTGRQVGTAQSRVAAAPQSSASRRKTVAEDPVPAQSPTLTTEVDMRYYRDLLELVPPEAVSVPLILHCMLEQVVATQEDIPPPSTVCPEPRSDGLDHNLAEHMVSAALSLNLSEEEKKALMEHFGVEERSQKKKESQHPLLLNYHNERSMRLHHLPVQGGFDAVKAEDEMLRNSPLWRAVCSAQPHSESRRRLARMQELVHFSTDESLSWMEVERAFRQFVFESMQLTEVDETGLQTEAGSQEAPPVPWNDPVSFLQHIRTRVTQDRDDLTNTENNQGGSEENKGEEREEGPLNKVNIAEIRAARVRSLRDWHFTEHHDPNVFPQILQKASEMYGCVDMLSGIQDNVLFVVCHNPMSTQRQSKELWDIALHTDVGFRNYLEHVADSISDWTSQEEVKWRALQEQREAEHLRAETPSEQSEKGKTDTPRKRSRASPRRSAASPVKSPCPDDPVLEIHIRQDSLKAWKIEQDRLREEELNKKAKKEREGKGTSKGGERSQSSRGSKKTPSATRRKREETLKTPDSVAPPEDGRTELQPPKDEPKGFTGYSVEGDLIQVWGQTQSLFPSDGGHIRVETVHFIQGPTLVKVCVIKDKHHFFTHITEPRRNLEEKEDDITSGTGGESQKGKRSVSKFGSFSAVLDNGIRLSFSHHSPSGESREERDTTLASVLNIPPPSTPSPAPSSAASPSPTGKRLKSSHSSKASRTKGGTPPAVLTEKGGTKEQEAQQEVLQKPVEMENCAVLLDQPSFQRLNASAPNGLLLQFLSEGVTGGSGVKGEAEGVMVRQSFPTLQHGDAGRRELPLALERSRVITSQGTVIKYMRDGSTEVLFPDGTVSNSPDCGTAHHLSPNTPTPQEEPVKEQRSQGKDAVEKKGKSSSLSTADLAKTEGTEHADSDHSASQGGAVQTQGRTWVTTTPSGIRVATPDNRAIDTRPLLAYKATDPLTGAVMITREDRVLTVLEKDERGEEKVVVEHADGTRVTTFYQQAEVQNYLETGEEVATKTRKQKMVRVECVGFAAVVMNCEQRTCTAVFGDGTVITAAPHGSYQVFPSEAGLLHIDKDGNTAYTSHPSHSTTLASAGSSLELQPGTYLMRHTADIICEAVDPEGNLFQVTVDGKAHTVISTPENYFEEEEEEEERNEEEEEEGGSEQAEMWRLPWVRHKEHSPRFFIIHEDGSGTELLHSRDVEDFLCREHSDPAIAVLKEPIPELLAVSGVTVLRPCPEDVWSRWLTQKQSDDIIPANLKSRKWDNFPSVERKTPGPPFGTSLGRGLYLNERTAPPPPAPVLTCPEVLEVRQLIQHQPISSQLRRKLEKRLKRYMEHLLEREHLWQEMQVKEPRTEEERVHATDLLQLVLSLPDCDSPADIMQRRLSTVDVASLYTHTLSSALLPDSNPSKGSETDLDADSCSEEKKESLWASRIEQYRQELREAEMCRAALRNRVILPYFHSDIGKPFALTEEVPDMEALSLELPPFPRKQENPEIQEFLKDASEPDAQRPSNPTPHAAGGDAASQGRPTNPTPQAAAPPCPASATGAATSHAQLHVPQNAVRAHGPPSVQREGGSGSWRSPMDVAGNPCKEGLRLPSAILSSKPSSLPNQKFLSVEEPVRRKVRTVSVAGSQSSGLPPNATRGFQLLPAEVDFGVLREGHAYRVPVVMRNVGVDSCRFSVKQPPPATGLKVIYSPGPVAAGMKTDLQVELFAIADGEGPVTHYIQIQTETEILYLPVSANILSDCTGKTGGSSEQ